MKTGTAVVLACCCCVLAFYLSAPETSGGQEPARSEPLVLKRGDVVVFTGGEDVVASQENGYLEVLLQVSFSTEGIRFRNMGWEGDTVYEQRRDLNFGAWSNQLERVGASIVFAQFGQSESLQGREKLSHFVAAYEELLGTFETKTRRVVLLSPTPFEKMQLPQPDEAVRTEDLRLYVDAIRVLAKERGFQFVDLFTPLQKSADREPRLTRDGVHLSAYGHWLAARETARQLGQSLAVAKAKMDPMTGVLSPPDLERLRQTILKKNQLWFDHWRPMNWAFLHGDRVEQPSSHDHRNPKVRWFPQEMEKFLPLIAAQEREAEELARKLSTSQR